MQALLKLGQLGILYFDLRRLRLQLVLILLQALPQTRILLLNLRDTRIVFYLRCRLRMHLAAWGQEMYLGLRWLRRRRFSRDRGRIDLLFFQALMRGVGNASGAPSLILTGDLIGRITGVDPSHLGDAGHGQGMADGEQIDVVLGESGRIAALQGDHHLLDRHAPSGLHLARE